MLMPEAAVNEDNALATAEHEIWFTREILDVQAIAIPEAVCDTSYQHLRFSSFAADTPHILGAPYFADRIHNPQLDDKKQKAES